MAPDIPQHFRPLARFPFLLLLGNNKFCSPTAGKKECRPVPTLGISTWRVPLGSFSAWFDMKTHSFRKQRMRIPVPSLFLSTFFPDSGYACGLQSGKVRPRSGDEISGPASRKVKGCVRGTDAYPVPSLFFSTFFVLCAIQKALTCSTNMAAYTRN